MRKLTPLQRRTCEIWFTMKHPNQAEAYRLAGSKSRGNTLIVEACRTLKKPQCKEYLAKLAEKTAEKTALSAEEVVEELRLLAFANIKDYVVFGPHGVCIVDSSKLTREQAAAIAEVSENTYIRRTKRGNKYTTVHRKFKLHDKKGSLEVLLKKLSPGGLDESQKIDVHIHKH